MFTLPLNSVLILTEYEISTNEVSAFAGLIGLPPVIDIVGVSKKSKP